MSRENRISEIFETFKTCANDFKERNSAMFCEFTPIYKLGRKNLSDMKLCYAKIYFNNYIVIFKYTAHGPMSTINSILECYLCFEKTDKPLLFPMYNIMDIIDENNFDCFTIPNITNGDLMRESFMQMAASVEKYAEKISDLSFDHDKRRKLLQNLLEDMSTSFNINITEEDYYDRLDLYYFFMTNRFTYGGYICFLTGRYKKAERKYEKFKFKSKYEMRLLNEIKALKESNSDKWQKSVPSAILSELQKYKSSGLPQTDFREFSAIFLSWFVLSFLWAIPFTIAYYILLAIEKIDAQYITGISAIIILMMPSFILGIATSYFTRNRAYKIFFKKDYEKKLEMDYIVNSPGSDRIMKVFTTICFICATIFIVLSVKCNLKFEQKGFIDNREFFSSQGIYYDYSEVKKVYYSAKQKNGFGDEIDAPTYIIVLDTGKEITLYEYEDAAVSEAELIPLLKEKGIKIVK